MTQKKRPHAAAVFTAFLLLFAMLFHNGTIPVAGAAEFQTGEYTLNASMNFRVSPDMNAEKIGVIPSGTAVQILEVRGDWGRLVYEDAEGWISLLYSTPHLPRTDVTSPDLWLVADFSQWHEPESISWSGLRAEGVQGVILRAGGRGYGSAKQLYADSCFVSHAQSAAAAGLHIGVYFFSYALNAAEAVEEADFTVSMIRAAGIQPDMPVFIDIEDASGDRQHEYAGIDVCSAVCDAFCERIREAGYYPGVYSGKWFAETLLYPQVFSGRASWIAHYGVERCGYAYAEPDMWQFTERGELYSVRGYVDLSYCYRDFPAMIASGEPVPAEPDKPPIDPPEEPDPIPGADPHYTPPDTYDADLDFGAHVPTARWTTVKNPTCKREGVTQRRCADCGLILQHAAIPRIAHTPGEPLALPADTVLTPGDQIPQALLRSLSPAGDDSTAAVITVCTLCKEVLTYAVGDGSCAHTETETDTIAPTCVREGLRRTVCTACMEVVSAEITEQVAHTKGVAGYFVPDCAQGGTERFVCPVCDTVLLETYLPPAEHRYSDPETVSPATLSEGALLRRTCAVCGSTADSYGEPLLPGDADGDGLLSAADARLLLRFAVGLETMLPVPETADPDGNGTVDAADARLALRLAVGLEDPEEIRTALLAGTE